MIDTKELRIGNLLSEPVIGISSVYGIYERVVYMVKMQDSYQYTMNIENLSPIPLTPEILEKCGFDKGEAFAVDKTIITFTNNIALSYIDGDFALFIDIEEDTWYSFSWTQIKYLHQLQNLYWCLCGKELEVLL